MGKVFSTLDLSKHIDTTMSSSALKMLLDLGACFFSLCLQVFRKNDQVCLNICCFSGLINLQSSLHLRLQEATYNRHNIEFNVLPKDTIACGLEEPGIKPPTL